MKVGIVGCGAMGSIYAGFLARAGHSVVAIDHHQDHIDAMNRDGLLVEGPHDKFRVRLSAHTDIGACSDCDVIVIAVKAMAVGGVATSLKSEVHRRAAILTIQNGVGAAEDVLKGTGRPGILVGIAGGFGAKIEGPGHVTHKSSKVIKIGCYGEPDEVGITRAVAIWSDTGLNVERSADISVMLWEKLVFNVAFSAPSALTGMTVGQILADEQMGAVCRDAAREAWEIGRASGLGITIEDPVRFVEEFGGAMPGALPSMRQDVEMGRPSEIDYINGAVPRVARQLGMAAPVNDVLSRLVRTMEGLRARSEK